MLCLSNLFLIMDQMHNKALSTSFVFKHGSRCVSFTSLSLCSCKITSQTVEEKTLTNKFCIIFFSTSFSFSSFPSFCSFYFFFFYSLFFYFLLQPMLIVTNLSWFHKFQLHFISLMPQIKRMFTKIEYFKTKSCPSQMKMERVHGSNIT